MMDVSVLAIVLLSAFILPAVKAMPKSEDARRFDGRDQDLELSNFSFDAQDRLSNKHDEKESRSLDISGLGALGRYPGNNLRGLLGSLGGFPASQSASGITGQNINQNLNQGLFRDLPGHSLNSLLAPQGLIGAASRRIGSNPNLIGGQTGLRGALSGLIAGTNGLGNSSPQSLLTGHSPIGDIMAMASFLTKDELRDMFSEDKHFNFIPVILQNQNKQQEDQEIQQFIRFLNAKSEKDKETGNTGFEKRGQRSLSTNPLLAQPIGGHALQLLAQQYQLQSLLQGQGINPLLAPQGNQPSFQSQLQSSQVQGNQATDRLGLNPIVQQALLQQARLQQAFPTQQINQASNTGNTLQLLAQQNRLQSLLALQGNQPSFQSHSQQPIPISAINSLGLNPIVQQALLQQARLREALPTQKRPVHSLKQQLLQSGRDSDQYEQISSRLPREHKQERFRFPGE